jgi:hypothetical protein
MNRLATYTNGDPGRTLKVAGNLNEINVATGTQTGFSVL